jgi:hypothetical protein
MNTPIRIGIGGPVGSGKTALVDALCKSMRGRYRLGVITNEILTREDMEFLVRSGALAADRVIGVQTGGCPRTAIREAASMNFEALDEMAVCHPDMEVVLLESGGDNRAASFSLELVDASIYVTVRWRSSPVSTPASTSSRPSSSRRFFRPEIAHPLAQSWRPTVTLARAAMIGRPEPAAWQ